jgi:glutamine amidotransferase
VGSFDVARRNMQERGLDDALQVAVLDRGVPMLGICLGLQLLANGSEEGTLGGLGWIDGSVCRLPDGGPDGLLRIPHMGWNRVHAAKPSAFDDALDDESRFYFVHTYAIRPSDPTDVLFTTTYGSEFVSGVQRDNITAVQFHPEKSHRHGKALLIAWTGT